MSDFCHFSISDVRFAFWAFFRKPEKLGSHRVKKRTRWPGRERWPIDPVTQWPSSMSGKNWRRCTRYWFCSRTRSPIKTRMRTAVLILSLPSLQSLFCKLNKTVTDRRLRPRCCHMASYFKRPKNSPVLPLACNWYRAQFIAKPKAACALRLSWAATGNCKCKWFFNKSPVLSRYV